MEGSWSKKIIVQEVVENRFTLTFNDSERLWLITLIRAGKYAMAQDIVRVSVPELRDGSAVAREFLTTLGVTP